MQYGNHIKVWRGYYYHHGIYVGGGQIIHYQSCGIVMTGLEEFCKGASPEIVHHPEQDFDRTVSRAYERLGENLYNLVLNNCESFANWCAVGHSHSHQSENAVKLLRHTFFAEFW